MAVTLGGFSAKAQTTATLTIQANQPGAQISSNLFGIFFEEINHAGDGGIYAEMVSNRNFEAPGFTAGWQFITTGSAAGTVSAASSLPLSASNLYSARLNFSTGSGGVGFANNGYWGMHFQAGQTYHLAFYARCSSGFTGAIYAGLESANGNQTYAEGTVTNLTTNWQYFSLTLVPNRSDTAGRLAMVIAQPGSVWLDVVSLFPQQTFDNLPNGMRPDLMNLLVNLQPSFMRFPGGSWVNGNSLTNMYEWKRTIGPLGDRWYQNNLWGYYVDNGQGYFEYLQMCEDLGVQPLFVINCGMDVFSAGDSVPLAQMGPYVQDALDAIQYANGPTNSTWGALRAAAGHPAPFNLKYIEIGNENGGSAYNDRYALFYDAIKANDPDMHIIADNWGGLPTSDPVEISDEHYYSDPTFFMANATKYESYSRSGPKVYVGEYAVTTGGGHGNLIGALGEAAFMTGLERNADIVAMASYAPLFANVNAENWYPDLIYFNNAQVYGTPSYYVQQMFFANRGDTVLPLAIAFIGNATNSLHGAVGLGSWNTSVQYANVVVTSNGVTLYQSDFNSGASGWRVYNGSWGTSGGVYQQTAITTDCRSTTGNTNWANYTISVRARKVSGNEGFLILFNWLNDTNWTWFNVGGWNNTQTAVEQMVNGTKSIIGQGVVGSVQTGTWYDLRIVLTGLRIQCYVNNTLTLDVSYPVVLPLYASASYANASGQIILKAVNTTSNSITTTFNLNGLPSIASQASLTQLTSANPLAENSPANPTNIYPVNNVISNAATIFGYTLPANSLSVIRFQTPPPSPVLVGLAAGTNLNYLDPSSGGIPVDLSSFITNNVSMDFTVEAADGSVVTNGTLQFVPGQTNQVISLPTDVLQPGAFFRVNLSNPANGQLNSITNAFFAVASSPGGPLQLGVARYPDENLVYWTATNATLLEATNLAGPWTTNSNQSAPIQVPGSPMSEFFRLTQ
ncbi:MAG TPA: alpha-L-arabinofuranosidase C-terminal domain-containing protein [Candidatus Limnocylindrales bacterium]|nr:alpha-L-arabinofuranosidase C-terminal domain-containing protein [Candidatus Limnocylindrales bacterium]